MRKASVDDQTKFVSRIKDWRNDIWFAVGKYNSKERVFAGACSGDSGGPLFAILNGRQILAGITSWGAEDCEIGLPSVYVRLSYYTSYIRNTGIPQLLINESKQNRALPSVLVEPKIIGVAKAGAILTCDPGKWSENTSEITAAWSGSGVPYGFSGSSITVAANTGYYAKEFICTVRASNTNGSVERRISITQNPPPSNSNRPVITNMPTVAFNGNITVSCNPGVFTYSNSVTNEWWIGDSAYSAPTTKIGTGNSVVLGQANFTSWGGKYLYCHSIATGDGGSSSSTSYGSLIPSFQRPIVSTYPKIYGLTSYQSPTIGTTATCSGWSWSNKVNSETVGWYINNSDVYAGSTLVQNGASIVLTQSFLETYKSKYLMCAVAGVNDGGTQIIYTTHYLYYYQTATPTPTPTPTPTASNPISSVKPNAPLNFGGTIGATSVSLSWTMPGGNGLPITNFSVERSSATSGWTVINSTSQVTYTDTGLTPGLRYSYRVRAFNGYNYSDYSSTISANIPVAASPTPSPTPTPSAPADSTAPVGSSWNNGAFAYPGGSYTASFKVTDNVGVTKVQFVLVKGGVDVLTQPGVSISGLADFYSGTMTIPSNATGTYGIRFEAFDSAGNKYSWLSNGSPTIVSNPVYLGGASYSTTSSPTGRVKVGDTFSCNSGNWANLGSRYQIFCLWSNWTTGAQYEGPVFTVTQALAEATTNKTISVTLKIRDAVSGTIVGGYIQEPGGLGTFIMDQLKAWSLDGPR